MPNRAGLMLLRQSLRPAFLFAFTYGCCVTAGAAPPLGYQLSLGVYGSSTNHVYTYSDLGTRTFAQNGVFGASGDIPVAGDFDGNGVTDLAVFRSGTWYIDSNHDFGADTVVSFGMAGDIPLAGDVDGDGRADLVVYRSGTWLIRQSSNGQTVQRTLGGAPGDQPVVGDFDGDGIADLAIFRSGTWLIQTHSTNGADVVDHFGGMPGDVPCAVDWNQDGHADLCVFRGGVWYFKSLGTNALLDAYAFGAPGDLPLSGVFDYAGAIYVSAAASGTQDGTPAHPFATIAKAFDAAVDGSVIRVGVGTYGENVVLNGPAVNYAPGKFGKNNIRLIGASRRGVKLTPASGDAVVLQGSSGNVLSQFTIGSTSGRGVVLIGGAGSVSPGLPGSSLTLTLDTIANTQNYGVLITGASHADILYNRITGTKVNSGIGTQSGAPSAVITGNEIAQNGSSGIGGNGIEAQQSSSLTITANQIHDNTRFGIIGINDSHLTISNNSIVTNQQNGIIICGAAGGDTSTANVAGNRISGNGVDVSNGQGYNGLEFYGSCTGTQSVSGNTFDGNSLNGIFVGSGTANISANTFSTNRNGITVYADSSSSANTVISVFGNTFTDNLADGVFAQLVSGSSRTLTATIGGTLGGQSNVFTGQGLHGIGCLDAIAVTCPAGGNTFSQNANDIEAACPKSCVK